MAKTNLELVQEMFELKLNNLNDKLDVNNKNLIDKITADNKHFSELLFLIKEQTTKTNGTVSRHEQDIKELVARYNSHLLTSATVEDIEQLEQKIEKLNEENFILKVWNKYPKALVTIIVVTVLVSLATLGYTMVTVHNALRDIKTVEKIEQNK